MEGGTVFQSEEGEPLEFLDAVVGGRSVGVPGTPMLLEEAHRRWGRANWAGLFTDAIRLADDGFPVSPRLAGLVADDPDGIGRFPETAAYFLPDGRPIAAGARLRNPAYASTLRRFAEDGADVFYEGPIAADIVATVRGAAGNPGVLALSDLSAYRVVERPPVCAGYRGVQVCGMGPPSSGAVALAQILGMLEPHDPGTVERGKLAADRRRHAPRLRRPWPLPRRYGFRAGARAGADRPHVCCRPCGTAAGRRRAARGRTGPRGTGSRRPNLGGRLA